MSCCTSTFRFTAAAAGGGDVGERGDEVAGVGTAAGRGEDVCTDEDDAV